MNAKQRKQRQKWAKRIVLEHFLPMAEDLASTIERHEESPAECAAALREMIAQAKADIGIKQAGSEGVAG